MRGRVERALARVGVEIKPENWEALEGYWRELGNWKERVALTGITDEDGFWKLVGESLLPLGEIDTYATYLDVGSGGGFPALPLLICGRFSSAVLLEPSERRAYALQRMIKALGLAETAQVRSQDLEMFVNIQDAAKMGLITVKGIKVRKKLVRLLIKILATGGRIIYYREIMEGWEESLYAELGVRARQVKHPRGEIRGYLLIKRE